MGYFLLEVKLYLTSPPPTLIKLLQSEKGFKNINLLERKTDDFLKSFLPLNTGSGILVSFMPTPLA